MKQILIALTVLFIVGLTACNQKQNDNKSEDVTSNRVSPIEGNWVTVSLEQNGKVSHPKRVPQQFKMFHDGYFSLVMYDTAGNFLLAAAGPYEVNGNMYKETFAFHSGTNYINGKDWQKWELKGDTLFFYGFEKAEMADGTDVTQKWNASIGNFIEKRVRVK